MNTQDVENRRNRQYTAIHPGTKIKQKACIEDLGVFMSENAKFDVHIKNTAAAGHRIAVWALRAFKTRSWYQMLVVPKVEYCCPLWSPVDSRNINLLESVQRRFTRRFSAFQTYDMNLQMPICTVSYVDRLKRLKIYSLERRRECFMILYIHIIIIGLVPNPGLKIEYSMRTKPEYSQLTLTQHLYG